MNTETITGLDKGENIHSSRIKEESQNVGINTDGRDPFDWKSRYPQEAKREIRWEAFYIVCIFILSFLLLLLNYLCVFSKLLQKFTQCSQIKRFSIRRFEYLVYFLSSGLLGGSIFGVKYFYRVIARGYWTQDRRYWRIFSPFISMTIAFIVGTMASSGILNSQNSSSWAVSIGFFAGYFADEAVGKMYEIATLLFGKTKNR